MNHFSRDVVYIDYREPTNVQEAVKDFFFEFNIETKVTRMDVGDFYYNNVLIERKDCIDFVQSMRDARLHNQRNNMIRMAQKGRVHPYVLINGTFYQARKQMKKNTCVIPIDKIQWISSVCHLLELGIGVYMTDNRFKYREIGMILFNLAKYFNDDKPQHDIFVEPEGMSWDMKAFQCFSGIGYNLARELSEKISIYDLMDMSYDQQIHTLSSVKGIGEKKAEVIIKELRGQSEDEIKGVLE